MSLKIEYLPYNITVCQKIRVLHITSQAKTYDNVRLYMILEVNHFKCKITTENMTAYLKHSI